MNDPTKDVPVAEERPTDDASAERTAASDSAETDPAAAKKKKSPLPPLTPKQIAIRLAVDAMYILASSLCLSCGIYFFVLTNDFAPGGISGIATMLEYLTHGKFSAGYSLFLFNLPLLILSFFFINRKFAVSTTINVVCQSLWMLLLEWIDFSKFQYTPDNGILAAIAAGVLVGTSIALALKGGGSTGGTDILAMMIQRKFSATNIAWFIFLLDCIVIGASLFVYTDQGLDPVMLAAIYLFISSVVNEKISNGFHSALKVEIVTKKPEELATAIMTQLKRGVTNISTVGMYTHSEGHLLVCLIGKRQLTPLKRILKQIDPDAFSYVSTTSEVVGRGFLPR